MQCYFVLEFIRGRPHARQRGALRWAGDSLSAGDPAVGSSTSRCALAAEAHHSSLRPRHSTLDITIESDSTIA